MQKKNPSVRLSVCGHDNSSKSEPIWMNLFFKTSDGLSQAKFEDEHNRSSGSGDMGKKVVKLRSEVPESFFEKISRNMTDTEKMMMMIL